MSKKWQRPLLGTLAVIPLVLALGCGSPSTVSSSTSSSPPGSGNPLTIQAANGTVHIAARPTAIVSLSPTATEMLYAIGAGSQVKAVDRYSDYPQGTPMTTLDGNSPNVEAIASYKPDLVVVSQDSPGLDRGLRALGIPVLSDPAATDLAQEYQQFAELGEATGHSSQAATEVASIKSSISRIVAATPKPRAGSYYYELDQTYYSVTSSTFIGQVLGLLGLKSIADSAKGAAASGGYPQLSGEFIVQANPDYVFLADTICCNQSSSTVSARPGWSTMSAVKDGRILGLNDDIASRWGPRIVDLLSQISDEIRQHPVGSSS
jgi:iron complex transport system substrate-binding protein